MSDEEVIAANDHRTIGQVDTSLSGGGPDHFEPITNEDGSVSPGGNESEPAESTGDDEDDDTSY